MKNKKFLLGMLVMILAFGMTVVGCGGGDEEYPAELKVTNSTSVDITLVELRTSSAVVKSDRTVIPAGQNRTYEFDSTFDGSAKVELSTSGVPLAEVTIDKVYLYPGYKKGHSSLQPAKIELLVSGTILGGFELSIN